MKDIIFKNPSLFAGKDGHVAPADTASVGFAQEIVDSGKLAAVISEGSETNNQSDQASPPPSTSSASQNTGS